jgi:hypothetical protein
MILHAASIAAFFASQTPQARCVVQCASAAPDSWLKWLLPTIVQTVISLASITAGVLIAVWSFRKTKELTEWSFRATSERDHERWILDQKKSEWRKILTICNEIDEQYLLPYKQDETLDALIERVRGLHSRVRSQSGKYVFISDTLNSEPLRFSDYTQGIEQIIERWEALRFTKHAGIRIPEEYNNLRSGFQGFVSRIGTSAQVDLGLWRKDDHGMLIPYALDKTKK